MRLNLNLNLNLVQVGTLNKNSLFQAMLQNDPHEADFVGQFSFLRKIGSISGKKKYLFRNLKYGL